jgi:hypothetical protein
MLERAQRCFATASNRRLPAGFRSGLDRAGWLWLLYWAGMFP